MEKKPKLSYFCCVRACFNTSTLTPDKIFFKVPRGARRNSWFGAIGRFPGSLTSNIVCCEDHFDLPDDMENYLKYKLLKDEKVNPRLKNDVVPHKNLHWKNLDINSTSRNISQLSKQEKSGFQITEEEVIIKDETESDPLRRVKIFIDHNDESENKNDEESTGVNEELEETCNRQDMFETNENLVIIKKEIDDNYFECPPIDEEIIIPEQVEIKKETILDELLYSKKELIFQVKVVDDSDVPKTLNKGKIKKEIELEKNAQVVKIKEEIVTDETAKDVSRSTSVKKLVIRESQFSRKKKYKIKSFCCSKCDYRANSIDPIIVHTKKTHERKERLLKCSKCRLLFQYEGSLQRHLRDNHQNVNCFRNAKNLKTSSSK